MKYLILCFAMLIGLSSCKKDEDKQPDLPPETTTGANTAGFIVDGKTVVLPKNGYSSVLGGGATSGLSIRIGSNFNSPINDQYFAIGIANYGDDLVYSAKIRIHEYPKENKQYDFGRYNGESYADGPNHPQMVVITNESGETEWYYSSPTGGYIIFNRVDTINKVFSGTFEATLHNRFDDTKTMIITKGRFDINPK